MQDYFGVVKELIRVYEEIYADFLAEKKKQPPVDIDNYKAPVDYDREIQAVLDILSLLKKLQVHYRFSRLPKARWLEYLQARSEGRNFFIKKTRTHTVAEYEDVQEIGKKYDVDWQEILRTNDIRTTDITAGTILQIPVEERYSIEDINLDIFGAQDEEKAFGTDLENKIQENYYNDLKLAGKP